MKTKEQAKKKLQKMVEYGWILHAIRTEEEFLTDGETFIYIGTGNSEDWAEFHGTPGTDDIFNAEKWTQKNGPYEHNPETVEIVEHDYPDESGGYMHELVFLQKNKDVRNPIDEYEGWQDDFILEEGSSGYFWRYKNPY